MKPLRILLKGFMCYHDETEISFEGAPLWVLSGPNGSGKSAIFDAMTFALYGTFRGDDDRRDGRDLINHACDSLYIEFDFEVGCDQYRVIRGVGRKKTTRSIFRAIHLNPPNGGNGESKEVSDKKSLTEWVINRIGLDKEAFVTSVLLRQGQADTLLNLGNTDRKNIVKQLVNIAAYEKLYFEADKARKEYETEVRNYDQQLNALERVTVEDLNQVEAQLEASTLEQNATKAGLNALAGLKVWASQWQEWQANKQGFISQLASLEILLKRAVEIEANLKRYKDLDKVTPLLRQLWDTRQSISEAEKTASASNEGAKQYTAYIQKAETKIAELKNSQGVLKAELQKAQSDLDKLRQKQLDLAQPSQELKALEEYFQVVKTGENTLASYDAQLDEHVEQARHLKSELEEIRQVLPWLHGFSRQRKQWQAAKQNQESLILELAKLEAEFQEAKATAKNLESELTTARTHFSIAQQAEADAKADLKTLQERLERFEKVEGQPECIYCGQVLTEEHLVEERKKLNQEVAEVELKAIQTQSEREQTETRKNMLKTELKQTSDKIQTLVNTQTAKNGKLQESLALESTASEEAYKAYFSLPENFRDKICPASSFSLEISLGFPTPQELDMLTNKVQKLDAAKKTLTLLEEGQKERDLKVAELKTPRQRLTELQKKYPPDRVANIRQTLEELNQKQVFLTGQIASFNEALSDMESQIKTWRDEVAEWTKQKQLWQGQVEQANGQLKILRQNMTITLTALEARWEAVAAHLTLQRLEELEAEYKALALTLEDFRQLEHARKNQTLWKAQLNQLELDLAQIPEEARCTVESLNVRELHLANLADEVNSRVTNLIVRQSTLAETLKSRQMLEEKRQLASQEATLYKRLAGYFDKEHLQQWLLRESQSAIIDNANQILERISGGILQLDFRKRDEDENNQASGEVLDLVVHNRDTNAYSLSTELLSGSQRFRVAVSLAIGIGQYASHRTQSVRSIIIDEGFSSLDKSGRDEIIEEIYRLQSAEIMERIILVSHQEEFFNRFTHGWSTRLENGVTKVSLI